MKDLLIDKRKTIIALLIVLFIIIMLIFLYYFLNRIVDDNESYRLKDNLEVEVFSDKKVSDFIWTKNIEILDDKKINTTKIGKSKISFIYLKNNKRKRRGTFNIKVVDRERPVVFLSNSYTVYKNSNKDITSSILCADNYDPNPICKVDGYYDLNTVGSYKLTYNASDSSGNITNIPFTLYVKDVNKSKVPSENKTISGTNFSDVIKDYESDKTSVGIDVSKWQKEIDFSKVKASGASFVMIRVGSQNGVDGKYILDPYFERNIKEALKNNLKVGVYFYSYANSNKEAKRQAKWVINQIKDYDITMPVAFDWECYSSFNSMNISLFGLNDIANTFLHTIEEKEYKTMLYGSKNYLNSIWKYQKQDVWLAHYTKKTNYENDYVMWQLCDNGVIDGISTFVDINVFYHD